jgi:hypothetical protein
MCIHKIYIYISPFHPHSFFGFEKRFSHGDGPMATGLVYVTMVYGAMNRFIAGWARRMKVLAVKMLIMAAWRWTEMDGIRRGLFLGKLCINVGLNGKIY